MCCENKNMWMCEKICLPWQIFKKSASSSSSFFPHLCFEEHDRETWLRELEKHIDFECVPNADWP